MPYVGKAEETDTDIINKGWPEIKFNMPTNVGSTYVTATTGSFLTNGTFGNAAIKKEEQKPSPSPMIGSNIWIGSFPIVSQYSQQHIRLFIELYPAVDYAFGVIQISPNEWSTGTIAIFFTSRQDFDLFETWIEKYAKMFGGVEGLQNYLIPAPPTQMEKVFHINRNNDKEILYHMKWLFENCEDEYYLYQDMLFFVSENDYTLYKLTFN